MISCSHRSPRQRGKDPRPAARPLWKLVRSFSRSANARDRRSEREADHDRVLPSTRLKSPTIGIEPPSPIVNAFLPIRGEARASWRAPGLSREARSPRAGKARLNSTLGVGRKPRAHEGVRMRRGFFPGPARRLGELDLRRGLPGMTVLAPSPGIAPIMPLISAVGRVAICSIAGGPLACSHLEATSARKFSGVRSRALKIGLDIGGNSSPVIEAEW